MMLEVAVRVIVEGQVQGVGFRAWTVREARRHGLRGWVRNRRDGSVEAMLIGASESVTKVIEACGRGPRLAQVTRVTCEDASDDGADHFHERPSD
ncbi:MAG TPA: acylphosphatase [Stellaceae bacterium]|nr:acylphosphatase [Stellaceae bacterium]